MGKIYILYGSETNLLRGFCNDEKDFYIRIYNKKIPKPANNTKDITELSNLTEIIKEIKKAGNYNEIAFIGAAFMNQNKLFIKENEVDIEKMIDINILSYVKCVSQILPTMIKMKKGTFIFLSSFRAKAPTRGTSIYSASKIFVETFLSTIGKEYGALGISTVSIRLGAFDGKMFYEMGEEKKTQIMQAIGNRKLGSPNDLQNVIRFIVENNYLNGGIIDLDGGLSYN